MKKQATMFFVFVAQLLVAGLAMAAEGTAAATGDSGLAIAGVALGAGLAIGLGAFGGGLGQGKAAAAALEGIARNPGAAAKIQTPMIIGLALIESLVIYALLIAYLLQAKLPSLAH